MVLQVNVENFLQILFLNNLITGRAKAAYEVWNTFQFDNNSYQRALSLFHSLATLFERC